MDRSILDSNAVLEAEAGAWLARWDGDDWSDDDQAAFDAWLDRSAHHRVTYLRLESAWRRADRLKAVAPLMGRTGEGRLARPLPRSTLAWRVGAGVLAVASAVIVVALMIGSAPSTYSTPLGGRKGVTLADGSRIELNTASRIKVDYTDRKRTLTLQKGEVYFEMKHDAARPVEILAGDRRVTMLGTKFSVRKDSDQVIVTVTQGRVRVAGRPGARNQAPSILSADEMLATRGDSAMVVKASPEMIADQLSWRQGRLTFHQTTLSDAAEEFNRYNTRKLVVSDAVAQTRIGGSFDPTNLETFAALVRAGFGYRVEESADRILISN